LVNNNLDQNNIIKHVIHTATIEKEDGKDY
jgi:hypothetical protein